MRTLLGYLSLLIGQVLVGIYLFYVGAEDLALAVLLPTIIFTYIAAVVAGVEVELDNNSLQETLDKPLINKENL